MAAIFDLRHAPLSFSIHINSTVFIDPDNVGIVNGISLLSCIKPEIIASIHIDFRLRRASLIHHLLRRRIVYTLALLLNPDNVGVAVGIW